MDVYACLKNEFMEDEKCHNLMSWLISIMVSVGNKMCRCFVLTSNFIPSLTYESVFWTN